MHLMTHLLAVCLCINGNAAKPVAKSYASDYRYIYNPAGAGGRLQSPVYVKDQPEAVAGGRYSYVDGNGVIQTTQYISDVLGFKAAAPNAPQEVVQYSEATVKAVPVQQVIAARGQEGQKEQSPAVLVPAVSYSYLPYATNFAYYFTPGTQAAVQEPNVAVSEPGQTVQEAYNLPDHSQIPAAAVVAAPPVLTQSQFHARDELGQYQFGYSDPNSARIETKTADGVVRGSYNYVDDQGKIQTVQYVADALGFRAGGTAFPVVTYEAQPAVQDTPEVIAARKQHAELFAEIQARDEELRDIAEEMAQANQPVVLVDPAEAELGPSVHSLPTNDEDDVPLLEEKEFVIDIRGGDPIADAEEPHTRKVEETNAALVVEAPVPALVPEANPAGLVGSPVAAPSSGQHHAQDELGQYNYGYTSPDSSKVETKTVDGTVRGAYNYIDSNGKLQHVEYISDALGFRVAATNLPQHVIGGEDAAAPAKDDGVVYAHLPYAVGYTYLLPPGEFQDPNAEDIQGDASVAQPEQTVPDPVLGTPNTADEPVPGTHPPVGANGHDLLSPVLGYPAGFPTLGVPVIQAKVAYSYLPYAVNHQYYQI